MLIHIQEGTRIENPRDYAPHAVDHLRRLLTTGSPAQADPDRENFYEIEAANETYYVHISPISGTVVLLAKWLRQPQGCCLTAGNLVA